MVQTEETYNQAIELLKNDNVRITKQRTSMLDYLFNKRDYYVPITEIDHKLRQEYSRMSYETVYRNVEMLEELHVVETRMFNNGLRAKYQCDFDNLNHSHFICENCGRVVELAAPAIKEVEKKLPNFQIDSQHYEVMGLCDKCLKQQNK
ncbi:Fur family transcriptional regulator [Companilactobacillus versmoldensis]|uniref:Fe2+ Zn2+ uptake regulation protein n=1 Tax=Companilactobacillus versmoldensis DSM 14857 = KCTC 3814 TaxID=1423815 RepID=A0A0R1SED3_9LACO|nr:Fur family transcriptional regulator [Companilactobacillus versmoldensis]KRL67049.1 Fe2+ Zn2+ uptake regulation protein [Companilactobacillus versmoldensis DSM 14857 = KCTC 3814]